MGMGPAGGKEAGVDIGGSAEVKKLPAKFDRNFASWEKNTKVRRRGQ